ncbi:MAG: FemAB family PEP-CTERM system-associated protein [Acidobacteria bacterium]|nr:MAG: FemAB family PEP-CTERM system-associated protein [Acidobacteriota bacterium]
MVTITTAQARTTVSIADDGAEWNAYVDRHADASGYHAWAWRHVFEQAFGHEAVYLVARREPHVVGVLPVVLFRSTLFGKFAVSLPFVNYGGVLADDDQASEALLLEARSLLSRRGARHLELRHRLRHFPALPAKDHKVTLLLDLPSTEEACWQGLDRKVRNQVRKAEKSGLTAEIGGRSLLPEFYAVFARNMRDLGTPVYSPRFFDAICAHVESRVRVVLVRLGSEVIAAGITHTHRQVMEMPWASSLKERRDLCPNNLLYWTVIREAIRTGHAVLDFGRSTADEGPYLFKLQWGAHPEQLWWEYCLNGTDALPDHSTKNPRMQTAIALWKRLPLPVASFIGPHVVRSIP